MKKRIIFLICACVLAVLCMIAISAETGTDEAATYISELGIELPFDAEVDYTSNITKGQFTVCIAQILSGEFGLECWDKDKASAFFSDVSEYGDAIDYVYAYGVLYEDNGSIFDANSPVMYQDALVTCVKVLGYDTGDISYPYGYVLCAQRLEIMSGIEGIAFTKELTVGELLQLVWNMLNTVVAAVDPMTEQVLYPDEKGLMETVYGHPLVRKTLLEKIIGGSSVEGDIDGDGVVNVKDVLASLGAVLNGTALENADMDGDGKVSLIDVLRIFKAATV